MKAEVLRIAKNTNTKKTQDFAIGNHLYLLLIFSFSHITTFQVKPLTETAFFEKKVLPHHRPAMR